MSVSWLDGIFYFNFVGPFPITCYINRSLLVAAEHLTGRPIAIAQADSTTQVVFNIVQREMSNGQAENFFGTHMAAVCEKVFKTGKELDEALTQGLYDYSRRSFT